MKKIFSFLIAILAIIPCAFSFVGCFNKDGGENEFDDATKISVTELYEIKLDEGYSFKFKNFSYAAKNTVEGLVEEIELNLTNNSSGIQAEGFYTYPETETDDAQTARFYIFNGQMYVNRAQTTPVKTTSDTKCYGKFSCAYEIENPSTISSLSGFAKKLAMIVNKIYTDHIDSSVIMGNYVYEGENYKRLQVNDGYVMKLKLTSKQEFESTSQTTTTETKLYYESKNVYRIYSYKKDVFAEVNMPVTTNVYKYLVVAYSGTVNTNIPVVEYQPL
ncbi:MAG: hypothetical protein IKC11_02485 [Clostridia bacterium]|nr:hypothetical protein [Clostridia bacterium]